MTRYHVFFSPTTPIIQLLIQKIAGLLQRGKSN